jgi:hypothetical protein
VSYGDTFVPRFDFWQEVTGVYGGVHTTFTLKGNFEASMPNASDWRVIKGVGFPAEDRGDYLTPDSVSFPTTDTTVLTFFTTNIPHTVLTGVTMRSRYEATAPVLKDSRGSPVIHGRTFAKRFKVFLREAANFTVFFANAERAAASTYSFVRSRFISSKKTVEEPVHREVDSTLSMGIYQSDPKSDFKLAGIAWELDFDNRGVR